MTVAPQPWLSSRTGPTPTARLVTGSPGPHAGGGPSTRPTTTFGPRPSPTGGMGPAWWIALPVGHYAVEIFDPSADETADDYGPIGYTTCRRTATDFRVGASYALPGVDRDLIQRNAWRRDELEFMVAQPDFYRASFGRLTGKCGCCGRRLTDPTSISRGIGPDCWARLGGAS